MGEGIALSAACQILLSVTVASLLPLGTLLAGRRLGIPAAGAGKRAALAGTGVALWLALTGALAQAGAFQDFNAVPPALARVLAPALLIVFALAFSRFGAFLADGLPYAALIGFQAFRIPVEGLLHWYHVQGRLPVQMTFHDRNWDILTGLTAVLMAWLAARGKLGRKAIFAWNLLGLGLLLNIMIVSILSVPGRLQVFRNEPANTLVFGFPYIWVPVVFVTMALLGHLVLFRKIARDSRTQA